MATGPSVDRVLSLGPGLPAIPERLLLAHARGQVLFIAGAGVSMPAKLPDFRGLVLRVYESLDKPVYDTLSSYPGHGAPDLSGLSSQQSAEVLRFLRQEYDVVLGMLERRIDNRPGKSSQVRKVVCAALRASTAKPAPIHKALMSLSDRGGSTAIITTNFDLLLQAATPRKANPKPGTYALGGIPRPGRSSDFGGVLHIHGALERDANRFSDLIVTDQDFGEFYLRRRTVTEFIYDAARLFHLVLVGYSANDPPMRYLLNAVAADGLRFDDLKERFAFVGADVPDPVAEEDWRGRGITPIPYDSKGHHASLLSALQKWAELSAVNGKIVIVDRLIRDIVKTKRSEASDLDRDLFDHLVRRGNATEKARVSALASKLGASVSWLDAILEVAEERIKESQP